MTHTSSAPAGGGWVLSAPDTLIGLARYQPPPAMLQTIMTTLQQGTSSLGVTGGTPVVGVYDDPKYDVYIIVAGYNGSGFDPAELTALETGAPGTENDGDARITHNRMPIEPGDHGGTAGCSSQLAQMGRMAAESTVCSWMTTTTFGSVTYTPKPDQRQAVYGTGPEVLGPAMRSIRAQFEHRG